MKKRSGVSSLRRSLPLSLLVHAFFFLVCAILLHWRAANVPIKQWTFIEIVPTLPEILKKKDDAAPKRRIVQTAKGHLADKAAPDAFLGEHTQTVDRETVNKDRIVRMGHEKSRPRTQSDNRSSAKELARRNQALPAPVPSLKELGVPILPDAKKQAEFNREAQRDEPNWASLQDDGMPKDYIKGLKESDATALNTKEYMFYGYYQRIRQRLDRAWIPLLRDRLIKFYQMGRQLASDMDHSTKVLVVLNSGGEVVRVQVVSESGTSELDDAAVKAFNKAGPFPNPPRGMIDGNGEIKVPWEFILRT